MLECQKCKLKHYKLNNNLCVFCDIVYNLKKDHSYKYIICYSEINQEDIINKTYEYFMKNDKIPIPSDIDTNSKIVSVNPYVFKTHIKNDNYKIFFTNCIDRNYIKVKRLLQNYPIEKFDINKFSGIELKKIDEKTYNDYVTILDI
jgi:hypothetical protein